MILLRFYYNIIIRIIILSVTALLFTWSWTNLTQVNCRAHMKLLAKRKDQEVIALIVFSRQYTRYLSKVTQAVVPSPALYRYA